jgi:hypothetical protein
MEIAKLFALPLLVNVSAPAAPVFPSDLNVPWITSVELSQPIAHGGRTNYQGCHNQRSNSSYHCH